MMKFSKANQIFNLPLKSFLVLDVTFWNQFIKFLVKLLIFNYLVTLFMAIIKILCGLGKMQNIKLLFSS